MTKDRLQFYRPFLLPYQLSICLPLLDPEEAAGFSPLGDFLPPAAKARFLHFTNLDQADPVSDFLPWNNFLFCLSRQSDNVLFYQFRNVLF